MGQNMKIFITGASGFVGGAAARHLAKDHQVFAMSRSEESDAKIRETGAVPIRSSLNNVTTDHLSGCDAVIHAAAYVEEWGPDSMFESLNVDGTKQLLETANRAAVKRFIHISTEAALFHGQHMHDIDENYPLALTSPFPYSRTKAKAEKYVRSFQGLTQTISLRPRMIWGPGDQTILQAVKDMVAQKKFLWINGGEAMTSSTHIDNLIHGIELALTQGVQGAVYFLTDGKPMRFRDFLTAYLATEGIALPDKSLPGGVVRFLAMVMEKIWKLFGIKSQPPITRFTAAIMSRDCTIRDDLARRELGYQPILTVEEGMQSLSRGTSSPQMKPTDNLPE